MMVVYRAGSCVSKHGLPGRVLFALFQVAAEGAVRELDRATFGPHEINQFQ